jgi:NADPH:quinone reductase-like Zn-dependent oxidoreductase
MPKNEAAWLMAKHQPLEVKEAPYTEPGAGEILVKNHAIAVNPVDWLVPYLGGLLFSWIKCPFVLGSDVAGEVVAVGSGVTVIRVGDRVLAMAAGSAKQRNRAAEGAFQAYTIVLPRLATIIPDHLSYVDAAVVPLGLTTAACGLFQSDLLALKLPTANRQARDQWVIVWGGSTSVGCNAIQLAAAAGYSVVTTASPKNFDYVKSLGAACAFDYNSKDVVRDIVAALQGKDVVGALAIGAGSTGECLDTLAQCRGRKFVASCSASVSFDTVAKGNRITLPAFLKVLPAMLRANFRTRRKSRRHGITEKFFDASSVIDNEIGPAIYRDYLGSALGAGSFRAAPPPKVVGHSLRDIQTALDIQRKGVSAAKIVVALD